MSFAKWCEPLLFGAALLTHGLHAPVETPPAATILPAFATKHPVGTTAAANGYLEYLPPGYARGKTKSPLLIAWHGRGEIGPGTKESLTKLNNNGISKIINEGKWDQSRPFVVLAPQHDGVGCPDGEEVNKFLQFAKATYKVDPERIYLTGLSCGARGIADYLAYYGGKEIAAAVLIAGDLSPAVVSRECSLARDLPLWIIHGEDDKIVKEIGDRKSAERLLDCSRHKEIRLDIYPGVGHDSWTKGYGTAHHDVFRWMLDHQRDAYRAAAASTTK